MWTYVLGGFLGWLTTIFFAGTLANYIVKLINKKWGKKISASPAGKKSLALLMRVFVKNHRYFGIGAFIALFLHFALQVWTFGVSISGVVAAALLVLQTALGIYAFIKKKPRKGIWFHAHRSIAILLIAGIALHLLIPSVIHTNSSLSAGTPNSSAADLKVFTLDELSKYNGQDGQPAYIAYQGIVYDVSNVPQWKNGTHNGEKAGTDVTNYISKSPHGEKVFSDLPQVGTLQN